MNLIEQGRDGRWIDAGVHAWVLEHWGPQAVVRTDVMAAFHEVVVCLSGSYRHTPAGRPPALMRQGMVVSYDRGERFDLRYGGELGQVHAVGFGISDAELVGLPDFTLPHTVSEDRALFELATSHAAAARRGSSLPAGEVQAVLRAFVQRCASPVRRDPIAIVKSEIDRNPAAPLYLAHLALMAEMKPDTFSRAFTRRYGLSPITYRVRRRLLEAGRLLIEAPEMRVCEIATRVGFDDVRNFHRAFRRRIGMSPVEFRSQCGVDPCRERTHGAARPSRIEPTELEPSVDARVQGACA